MASDRAQWLGMRCGMVREEVWHQTKRCGIRPRSVVMNKVWHQAELSGGG